MRTNEAIRASFGAVAGKRTTKAWTSGSPIRHTVNAAGQPDLITLKRLAIVDTKGSERVVISAPLPDPIIQGKRMHRDGPVSGVSIFDPKGNEVGMSLLIRATWRLS